MTLFMDLHDKEPLKTYQVATEKEVFADVATWSYGKDGLWAEITRNLLKNFIVIKRNNET